MTKLNGFSVDGILRDGEISISKDEWVNMNDSLDKDTIKQLISDAIGTGIDLPYRNISKQDATDDFLSLLEFDTSELFREGDWFTRYDYAHNTFGGIVGISNVGNKASDFHQQESRWKCDSINAPSPYRTWTTEKFRLTLLNALWSLKVKEVNNTTLRSCIGLRKYIASQFRPTAAKWVYDTFGAENVLDTSAGWGDRFAGFAASSAKTYTGIDPNDRVHTGYLSQLDMYSEILGRPIDANFINGCSENKELYDNKSFDLMFTSPPYFNIERYSQENDQSFKRYRKINHWIDLFLLQTIENVWGSLDEQGYMIINISDVYSNHVINQFCDKMVDFAKTLDGCEYIGTMGYEMRKRPNSGALKGKTGAFCEPVWVFKKHKRIF